MRGVPSRSNPPPPPFPGDNMQLWAVTMCVCVDGGACPLISDGFGKRTFRARVRSTNVVSPPPRPKGDEMVREAHVCARLGRTLFRVRRAFVCVCVLAFASM